MVFNSVYMIIADEHEWCRFTVKLPKSTVEGVKKHIKMQLSTREKWFLEAINEKMEKEIEQMLSEDRK